MKAAVVGGTGHVGKFMVPMLVEAGHEVLVVSTGRTAAPTGQAWDRVRLVRADVNQPEGLAQLAELRPEVVIDMPGTVWGVYEAVKKSARHVIACGSVWMFGEARVVPTPEERQNPCPFEGYARRYEQLQQLVRQSEQDGIAFTAIMPPNICGPGKIPLECLGGRDIEVHRAHAAGKEVVLPGEADALIGPCDAEDIARCFVAAVGQREQAAGEIFNVGSAYALTAAQFVNAYAEIYQTTIPIRRVSWSEYMERISPGQGYWWHFKAHMCPDISKARRRLGYEPQYTPEQTLARAVEWMRREGIMKA